MIAYIYFKESKMIICKIDNVTNIDINGKEINGDSSIRFGDSQDFIILQSDNINKNIGDTIDLTGIEDERDYFLKGKEMWLQEKLDNANNRLKALETNPPLATQVATVNTLIDDLSQMMVEVSTIHLN